MSNDTNSARRGGEKVAELQGLYGAFTFPEKVLQKIWAERAFETGRLTTTDGRSVRIGFPGKWNLLGGPDFTGARLKIGDEPERTGDVELHLRAEDWAAHRHAEDPAYRNVLLHVVLFSPGAEHVTRGANGAIPVAALLPLLLRDLESYADDAAVESLADRPLDEALRAWAGQEPAALRALLREHARGRWERKCRDAMRRVERLGWAEACHQTALEILGYRFNRVPMLRVAGRWSLGAWATGQVDVEEIWVSEHERWSVQGVRPANHPRTRLRQYARWTRARPEWPAALAERAWPATSEGDRGGTREFRRVRELGVLSKELASAITGGEIGGTRWDNLVCDGFLPLAAGHGGADLFPLWWHWFPGDFPEAQGRALRHVGVFDGREHPSAHGLLQGLIGWRLAQEAALTGRGA